MHALEQHALHRSGEHAHVLAHDHHVLRAHHHVHGLVLAEALVHALELGVQHLHQVVLQHHAGDDVALADEVRHEGVLRLVVDALGVADLLDAAAVHHGHRVRHGQGLLLVVGDVDEGDAQLLLHALELHLHLLAQLQIQRAQRLVQQQHLRLVHQRAGDGDALLLAAGQLIDGALLIALHLHQLEHAVHAPGDLLLFLAAGLHAQRLGLLQVEAEGDVVEHVQMGEQRVLLKHRVDAALVRRNGQHVRALEQHAALVGHLKAADDAQKRRLAAARGAQQRDEFALANVQIDVVQHLGIAEALADSLQLDQTRILNHTAHSPNLSKVKMKAAW